MSEKNRQHYVPKFYLRNFSDSENAIGTYNINNSKYISNASIKGMCQKHNFYGADNKVENFLSVIETDAATIIRNILDKNEMPNNESDYILLVMFLLITEARNLKMAESSNNMVDFLAKKLIQGNPEFKDLDIEKFKIEIKEPATHNIKIAIEITPLILDLEPILIVEQTQARKFITSDNPLIRYNSFYLDKNYPGGYGYVTRGLQIFFPISPSKCILLYDSLAYDIPEVKNGILILKRARDIDHLNELFYLNANNNVFFNRKTKNEYIEKLHHKNRRMPKINQLEREVTTFKSIDSNNELIHFAPNKVSKKINFSWIKTSKFTNSLEIPSHMGGINRIESPAIREALEKSSAEFAKYSPPFKEKIFR